MLNQMKYIMTFAITCFAAQSNAMVLPQIQYTVTSNAPEVQMAFGGTVISGKFKRVNFEAAKTVKIVMYFPKNVVLEIPTAELLGDLIILVRKFEQGVYTVTVRSKNNGAEQHYDVDFHVDQ